MKLPSATGWTTITSRACSPIPFCTTLFTLTPLSPRILATRASTPGSVRDLEVQVEGRLHLLARDQPQLVVGVEVHPSEVITDTRSPSTADAVWRRRRPDRTGSPR